ncbi:FMN-binding protein [Gryllotalpicola koreensis]|uniref:FMN-binding domain-containing protein n=1 Tax=Gryllotalpicola koreensis TaxID=993086 RepID=A0ABP8A946_9MICO
MSRKWQGTALFAAIMAGLSVTVAGRMLAGSGTGAAEAGGTSSSTSVTGGSGSSSGSGSSPRSSSGPSSGDTVMGSVEQTRFGPVQVKVTFDGAKITDVTVVQAPSGGGRDEMLTQYATPLLAQEVIASQSAKVDTISGATYTSEGYLASVQSAIDAHT